MSQAVGLIGSVKTMTSQEIAALTGKDHKNVLRDIRNMLDELEIATAQFSAVAKTAVGNGGYKEVEGFQLPPREVMILVTGYSVKMRAKVIDRVRELELAQMAPKKVLWSAQELADLMRVPLDYELYQTLKAYKSELGDNLQRIDRDMYLTADGIKHMVHAMSPTREKAQTERFLNATLASTNALQIGVSE